MKRRDFLQSSALLGVGLSLPFSTVLSSCAGGHGQSKELNFKDFSFNLLKKWCDGMINVQVDKPEDPTVHGLMECPGDGIIHARLQDAVYPMFYMAKATGDKKYLKAGINAFEWAEANVSRPDGSWTNALNPKSWNGTTVFGAIALAETLKHHSDLLDKKTKKRWSNRLREATGFIYKKFPKIDTTNVNYGGTNIYALYLIGDLLGEPRYTEKSKVLANEIKGYFTTPNRLLLGEIKPSAHKLSVKGLPGVDLGYNVEETLNSLVLYAHETKDEELLDLLHKSLNSHLEFMMPDGGWDNSWGTRMFKWTYWGSRTCDGCQPAFSVMADRNPAFGTAVIRNTELLDRCTDDGLLHGGMHYVSHGIKPCLHHTFTHAKSLAYLLDNWKHLPDLDTETPLPRVAAEGVNYFEELDTVLVSRGNWRATITAYDAEYYHKKDLRQATGASLSALYHNQIGLVCAASLAVYRKMEPLNQQDAPGKDIALTPRIETNVDGNWYTNLFDLEASFNTKKDDYLVAVEGTAQLKNEAREKVKGTAGNFNINYQFETDYLKIIAHTDQKIKEKTAFVLPIVSPNNEEVKQLDANTITIHKTDGILKLTSNVSMKIRTTEKKRTFNMVPGVEAVPIDIFFEKNQKSVEVKLEVV
ncbi:hypothetical protein [Flammeovirga sp. EKP202]|uniref:hypothetical protein n=1 Tax=Flammeovirga sp. EKP202 TaxID=2770592 RepID=UPI00165F08F0|nr:hypothetical protein [Flammeovirga sp. EKP202]MBD0401941.1 hypothetical protein [Flammeovirga sp. EKP202]